MIEFFDCSADNISLHLNHIFSYNELDENAVTEKFWQLHLMVKLTK